MISKHIKGGDRTIVECRITEQNGGDVYMYPRGYGVVKIIENRIVEKGELEEMVWQRTGQNRNEKIGID